VAAKAVELRQLKEELDGAAAAVREAQVRRAEIQHSPKAAG
jgi:hypothetical protein